MKYLKLDEAEKPCCIVGLGLMGEAFATSNCFQGSNFVAFEQIAKWAEFRE